MLQQNNIDILVISISSPILVGIYENNTLIKTISKDGKTSDVLPIIFDEILNNYKINEIIYINGPGSFMAIKVAYIFLKTICITKNLTLKACSGFEFNNNSPIKALGKKYFFNTQDDKIELNFLTNDTKLEEFKLPNILNKNRFSSDIEPNYNLPAVS